MEVALPTPAATAVDAALREEEYQDAINAVVAQHGWLATRDLILAALEADEEALWYPATTAIWSALLAGHDMDADRVIALLWFRLAADSMDGNLAWSIARNLKGVEYLSDYDPERDPTVAAELRRLRAR